MTEVQGHLGRSSFEASEAVAKAGYERRLAEMNHARWAHKVWEYAICKDHNTRWRKRTRALSYCHNMPVESLAEPGEERQENRGTDDKAVRRLVQEEEQRRWRGGMARRYLCRGTARSMAALGRRTFMTTQGEAACYTQGVL